MAKAKNSFSDTGINITNEGRRHLGGVIGSSENKNTYINNKIDEWCKEIEVLSKIATSDTPYLKFETCACENYNHSLLHSPVYCR